MEKIIGWSLNHRLVVMLMAGVVMGAGALGLRLLKVDAFPDTTPIQVQINTTATALVAEEVERQITFPIELAIGGMPRLEGLRSISQFGLSQVVVTFQDGTDIYFARQLINERLGSVEMPPGIERPQMGPVSTGLGEVFHYMLVSEGKDLTELRMIHDWTVKPLMRPVPGTAEINSWGGMEKQYQVRIDPSRLVRHDLTFDQVVEAVQKNNLNVGGGGIDRSGDMLLVHGVGRMTNTQQIGDIAVTAKEGVPIHVRDVADITIGHEIRRGAVTANGKGEVVLGLGFMLMGENSYAVTRRMADKMKEIVPLVPAGAKIVPVYDRTELVDQVIDTVRQNLCDGALLVIVLLFIFLGNLRAGLIVASAIPLSMMFAFFGMWQVGIAGTLLSLGAIDFGVVVDSSVVVVENIFQKLVHAPPGESRLETIRKAAIEVRKPAVYGQLIIMIVYLPILTLEGVEGKMFRPMAITVILVLIGSLILSLTFMPVLASLALPKKVVEHDALVVRIARWFYVPLLAQALNFRRLVIGAAGAAVVGALMLAWNFGSEFVPRLSEGAIVVGIIRPPGTSLAESLRINTLMERDLLEKFPDEISHVWGRVGAPEVATDPSGVEATDLFISLKSRDKWTKAHSQSELVEVMEKELDDYPGQTIWFTQPIEQRINEMVSGVRSDVALKLFGDDFDTLIAKAREMERVLHGIQGCVDLATEQIAGQPVLRITIKQDQIARYGVPAQAVLDLVESVGSKHLGQVVEGQYRFPLAVRLPDSLRESPESIASILLATPAGERIPLSMLADVRVVEGPKTISREWSKRRITVQCNVRGRDVGSFVHEAQEKLASVSLPEGYRLRWGGQFENLQRAQKRLLLVAPLALGLIVALLYFTYRNVMDTLLVFSSVPFACAGGVLAMQLRGMPLSISAAVGFITLSGVSVMSSMVFSTHLRSRLADGIPVRQAVERSALCCLRTILMTALVASVGFVPMAISVGAGAEVQRPLATVVIGGVISGTLLALFVLPALYLTLEGWTSSRRETDKMLPREIGARMV